ncbi:hypothetical protein C8J56DRAFT_936270 [Mycena floridula]|nr:hypothetical protein C8J56DRAFT_936270 [Mycena floridula]
MSEADAVQNSEAELWFLKPISFNGNRNVKIITQNYNGPCSFIAICNILILRGDIEIAPPERRTVSYEFLCQLVGEYLLLSHPDVDTSAALSIMPHTQKGMDLNPLFTNAKSFRPAGDGGELKLFQQVGIELVHGWLVDPESQEAAVMAKTEDYDNAVNLIVSADHTAKGQLVIDEDAEPQAGSSSGPSHFSEEERTDIEDAILVRRFLDNTKSQLTYHGLFTLATTISPGSPVALFRNLHLSVLYKPEGEDASLYCLVTDQVFLHETSVVWERIEDVDGGSSTFVDSNFIKSSPAGGDFAGQTAEDTLRAAEIFEQLSIGDPADFALAQQLQAEEDNYSRNQHHLRLREKHQRALEEERKAQEKKEKKKKDCIIM